VDNGRVEWGAWRHQEPGQDDRCLPSLPACAALDGASRARAQDLNWTPMRGAALFLRRLSCLAHRRLSSEVGTVRTRTFAARHRSGACCLRRLLSRGGGIGLRVLSGGRRRQRRCWTLDAALCLCRSRSWLKADVARNCGGAPLPETLYVLISDALKGENAERAQNRH